MRTFMNPAKILVIEDSIADISLLRRSFKKASFDIHMSEITDGEEALNLLVSLENSTNSYWPNLILLDLNLPKVDGYEILKKIKLNKNLESIPVFIYSSSEIDNKFLIEHGISPERAVKKPRSLNEASIFVEELKDFILK